MRGADSRIRHAPNSPKGTGRLLTYVKNKLGIDKIQRTLSDDDGPFGYVTEDAVVVAKLETYGDIVSCHKKAAVAAHNTDRDIVMYLDEAGEWYQFDAYDVLTQGHDNERRGEKFTNFDIRKGRKIDYSRIK